ncbi:MAG: aminotransferase class V-fold PLP-dependent enzyme, partial [Firmicutes bacterium]|nr:aminotransferase class V-fold PLP-dependent enzyme [Bacillota bacterium]
MTGIHQGSQQVHELCQAAYNEYFHTNAVIAEMEPGLGRMQDDILRWTVDLLNGGTKGRANMMVGGSESIFCAVHAAREWARENLPNAKAPYQIVMPRTGHAAFDKAAHYLGLKMVRVPTGNDLRADVDALNKAITPNTIMIVGSAPCWGLGLMDPIPAIAAIAEQHNLWMHVDCCVGGFLLPFMERLDVDVPVFDFRLKAVHSISADLHKHGFAAKPASTVLYRSEDLQHYHNTGVAIENWQSGMYKSHGVVGSRPGSAVAAAWAVMSYLGEEGYMDITRRTLAIKERMIAGIEDIEDFQVLRNESLLVPFRSNSLDMLNVFGGLVERGYFPWGTFDPMYVHPSAEP